MICNHSRAPTPAPAPAPALANWKVSPWIYADEHSLAIKDPSRFYKGIEEIYPLTRHKPVGKVRAWSINSYSL